MTNGPVELLLIEFPGSRFDGSIIPEVRRLVDERLIAVIDVLFIHKAEDGSVLAVDLEDLEDLDLRAALDELDGEYGALLSDEDVADAAASLTPGSSAGLLVFENLWAAPLVAAIRNAGGVLVANQRVPMEMVDELLAVAERREKEPA